MVIPFLNEKQGKPIVLSVLKTFWNFFWGAPAPLWLRGKSGNLEVHPLHWECCFIMLRNTWPYCNPLKNHTNLMKQKPSLVMVQLLCTTGLWVHIPYKKHKISDCEPRCGIRTCWTGRLVKEADMGEVRSGISWPKGREDQVLLVMVGTRRNRAERAWGVERGGVSRWMVTEMVGAETVSQGERRAADVGWKGKSWVLVSTEEKEWGMDGEAEVGGERGKRK